MASPNEEQPNRRAEILGNIQQLLTENSSHPDCGMCAALIIQDQEKSLKTAKLEIDSLKTKYKDLKKETEKAKMEFKKAATKSNELTDMLVRFKTLAATLNTSAKDSSAKFKALETCYQQLESNRSTHSNKLENSLGKIETLRKNYLKMSKNHQQNYNKLNAVAMKIVNQFRKMRATYQEIVDHVKENEDKFVGTVTAGNAYLENLQQRYASEFTKMHHMYNEVSQQYDEKFKQNQDLQKTLKLQEENYKKEIEILRQQMEQETSTLKAELENEQKKLKDLNEEKQAQQQEYDEKLSQQALKLTEAMQCLDEEKKKSAANADLVKKSGFKEFPQQKRDLPPQQADTDSPFSDLEPMMNTPFKTPIASSSNTCFGLDSGNQTLNDMGLGQSKPVSSIQPIVFKKGKQEEKIAPSHLFGRMRQELGKKNKKQ